MDKNDPKLWKYVAKESKSLMSYITGLNEVDTGFRELVDFEEEECIKSFSEGFTICGKELKMRTRKDRKTDHIKKGINREFGQKMKLE